MLDEQKIVMEACFDVHHNLAKGGSLQSRMQGCTDALLNHLELTVARIWIFNESENLLELLANSTTTSATKEQQGIVPLSDRSRIGLVALNRKPYLSNSFLNELCPEDQIWTTHEGLNAFAAHPLIVADKLVGVIAMFAKGSLSSGALTLLTTISDTIALSIDHALIERKMAHLAAIVESTEDAIISKGLDGIIRSWNPSAERIFGYTAREAIGQPVTMLIPEDRQSEELEIAERLRRGERINHYETERQTKDGKRIHVSLTVSCLKDRSGNIIGASKILRDFTERKRFESKLDRAKIDLEQRVVELALLNKQLDAAKHQAQSATKLKSEFVANVSHEIRTPMNGIIGMSNILLRTELNEPQRRYANSIKHAADSLLTIINDILDFSKIEAGRIELEFVEFDLVSIVESVCDLLSTQARNKKLSLMSFVSPAIPQYLRGDPERIRQVLINLVSNAIKFTEEGEIAVKVFAHSQTDRWLNVCFSIFDNGIGLSDAEQQKLFQPFVQSDAAINRKFGGTGLGLSISKGLVELMNGTIGVESSKGAGSKFWFTIPLENRTEFSERPLFEDSSSRVSGIKVEHDVKQKSDRLILVVEDQPLNQQVAQLYLSELGFESRVVSNGREAIEAVTDNKYALVLMDCQMPEMDGITATGMIRKAESLTGNRTTIVAVTANAMKDDRQKFIAAGMDDYITKPIDLNDLRRIMEKWFPENVRLNQGKRSPNFELGVDEPANTHFNTLDIPALLDRFDKKNARMLLEMFLGSTPDAIKQLGDAIANKEFSKIGAMAHALRGACGTVYAMQMKDLSARIEALASRGEFNSLLITFQKLCSAFTEVRDYINVHLSNDTENSPFSQ